MKGLILAGGQGTRLRPITHTRAKQLVPVANTPILFYGIAQMAEVGITDIAMIIGGETGDEVRDAVGDGSRWGVSVTYIAQAAPLGLAHCVRLARAFLGDDDFVMYLGDNMLQHGLGGLVASGESARAGAAQDPSADGGGGTPPVAHILLTPVPDPHRFGVAELDVDGEVVRLVEKPAEPASDLVRGPAVIGPGAQVVDSYIGPFTSVGAGATILASEVENSVLLEGVRLEGVPRLVDSLIGRGTEVLRSGRSPRATRLLLGDHCAVDLQ